MAYDKGVIHKFHKDQFHSVFEKEQNRKGKLFLHDGNLRQNSKVACSALDKVGFRLFDRSLDVNLIKNIFHLVRKKLSEDALQHAISKKKEKV